MASAFEASVSDPPLTLTSAEVTAASVVSWIVPSFSTIPFIGCSTEGTDSEEPSWLEVSGIEFWRKVSTVLESSLTRFEGLTSGISGVVDVVARVSEVASVAIIRLRRACVGVPGAAHTLTRLEQLASLNLEGYSDRVARSSMAAMCSSRQEDG